MSLKDDFKTECSMYRVFVGSDVDVITAADDKDLVLKMASERAASTPGEMVVVYKAFKVFRLCKPMEECDL